MGDCKYKVYIRNCKKFLLAGRQPFSPRIVETLRAMPVTAAVVRDGYGMTASTTAVPVTSERCRSATFDGR
jgi:hypothetical protein